MAEEAPPSYKQKQLRTVSTPPCNKSRLESVYCFKQHKLRCNVAARMKRTLKTWMFIYVAFAATLLSTTASGVQSTPPSLHVPAVENTGSAIERRFFETRLMQAPRIDI